MRKFLKRHGNYDIYVWTTGKFEAYDSNQRAVAGAMTLKGVIDSLELEDEIFDGSSLDLECGN